jgi:hypothetical protein
VGLDVLPSLQPSLHTFKILRAFFVRICGVSEQWYQWPTKFVDFGRDRYKFYVLIKFKSGIPLLCLI